MVKIYLEGEIPIANDYGKVDNGRLRKSTHILKKHSESGTQNSVCCCEYTSHILCHVYKFIYVKQNL